MATTQEEFDSTVSRLTAEAQQNPARYKLRLLLLALAGYAYLFFVVGASLAVTGALVVIAFFGKALVAKLILKLVIPILAIVWFVLRSLWVRVPAPEGIEITRREAAPLFDAVEDLRRKVEAPRVHTVLLNDDFNASVVQIPRLGLFGWQKNYLCLGLPLMQALSPLQLKAVIAHELGHLSGAHGRFGCWIYRVRATWYQLMEAFARSERWGAVIFNHFFGWYVPYFGAYSFALARTHEYDADRSSAEAVGAREIADVLVNLQIYGSYLQEKFWTNVFKRAEVERELPSPYSNLHRAFREELKPEHTGVWYERALRERPTSEDVHPSLAERLTALGEEPRPPAPVEETAAAAFFGESLPGLTKRIDAEWQSNVASAWAERHEYAKKSQLSLQELDERAANKELSVEDAWQGACWTEEFRDETAAFTLYREILERDPEHTGARFAIGRLMLARGEESGVGEIEQAMEKDTAYVLAGCELLYGFFRERGREKDAKSYYERGVHHIELLEAARKERSHFRFDETYLPHELSDEQIARLVSQFAIHDEVSEAYLVRK